MKGIVFSTNYRNVDNWLPLFRLLQDEGNEIGGCWLPWLGDPTHDQVRGIPLIAKYVQPILHLDESGVDNDALEFVLRHAVTPEVDTVFLCDMQSYPSNAVYRLLRRRENPPIVIGLQHGLFQSWWLYNRNFCADHLLCFGDGHIRELDVSLRSRAHAVGLPKLDRLFDISTSDEGYILYLAQRVPNPSRVRLLLEELARSSGRKILIHSHPQYPSLFDSCAPLAFIEELTSQSGEDYLKILARSSWVLTPHSTAGLEALYLGKPLVLIPNHGLTAWAGYPGVAFDLTADEVISAFERLKSCQTEVSLFLEDKLGGMRFDSTRRAREVIRRLYADSEPYRRDA